jgi:hypothetical protein
VKRDLEHLRLLAVFHYVLAGLVAVTFSFGLIYVFMGIAMLKGAIPMGPPPSGGPAAMPLFLPWFFILFFGAFVLVGWTLGILLAGAGYCLSRHKAYTFCFILACVICLNAPLGTALGVCTILVLMRPNVKDLFAGKIQVGRDPDEEEEDPAEPARPSRSAAQRDDDRFTAGR